MNETRTQYLLPFDAAMVLIEQGLAQLPPWMSFHISVQEYVIHLLNWLSEKISDREATSTADVAIAYLKSRNVDEEFATHMSHAVMDCILDTVVSHFPDLSFQELASARYVLEPDNHTLSVYLRHATTHY